jgi:hypothetical protein
MALVVQDALWAGVYKGILGSAGILAGQVWRL